MGVGQVACVHQDAEDEQEPREGREAVHEAAGGGFPVPGCLGDPGLGDPRLRSHDVLWPPTVGTDGRAQQPVVKEN